MIFAVVPSPLLFRGSLRWRVNEHKIRAHKLQAVFLAKLESIPSSPIVQSLV